MRLAASRDKCTFCHLQTCPNWCIYIVPDSIVDATVEVAELNVAVSVSKKNVYCQSVYFSLGNNVRPFAHQGFFYQPLGFYRRPAVWRYTAVYR
jgi:hypothetical protein